MPRNWFNRSLPIPQIRTSVHDLSYDYKSSINFGGVYPTQHHECPPKTKFLNLSSEIFLRFAPMKFPIMHRCKVRQNYFAVPFRLIMGNDLYQKFHNGEIDIVPITIQAGSDVVSLDLKNTILDYLEYDIRDVSLIIPDSPTSSNKAYFTIPDPLAFLSYLLVWRTWYADEVLDVDLIGKIDALLEEYRQALADQDTTMTMVCDPDPDSTLDPNYVDLLKPLPVSYTKDYFSAAQTEPQRGGDVYLMNPLTLAATSGTFPSWSVGTGIGLLGLTAGESEATLKAYGDTATESVPVRTTDTIRDLWQKEQLQRYRDIRALFGDRTNEYLAGHFGVISSDARLQMPQFIGGGEQIVQISEVVQTSADTETSPMGALAGKGTSFGRTKSFKYFCEEHMFVFGLLSLVPDNGYMTGNPRYFYKKNILDFATPEFNNIGYQAVYKGEIFSQDRGALAPGQTLQTDLEEFGYQLRYSEYRQHRSIATGDFRDSTLMAWHLNRSFDALPPLNAEFIHVNKEDAARIFNNTDADAQHIYVDVFNKANVASVVSYMPSSMHL